MALWVLTEMDAVSLGFQCSVAGDYSEYLNKVPIDLTQQFPT